MANRIVILALRLRLDTEIDQLTQIGVITPVEEATPWVSHIVVTHIKSGDLRVLRPTRAEQVHSQGTLNSHSKSPRMYCMNYEMSGFSQKLT